MIDLSMHILITGAAGMIGRKLTARLVRDGALDGNPLTRLTLVDIVAPARPEFGGTVETVAADLREITLGPASSRRETPIWDRNELAAGRRRGRCVCWGS